uniref:Activin_recp domain-containing protein n=1 Tax=Panagrellus redivivus TaxID=6233 RepID=A0A7E4UT10_PANRE
MMFALIAMFLITIAFALSTPPPTDVKTTTVTDPYAECLSANIKIVYDVCEISKNGDICANAKGSNAAWSTEQKAMLIAKKSCKNGYNSAEIKHIFCCNTKNCFYRCKNTVTPVPEVPELSHHSRYHRRHAHYKY